MTLFMAFDSQYAISMMPMIETPVNKPTAPPEIEENFCAWSYLTTIYIGTNYSNLILDGEPCIPLDLHDISVEKLDCQLHSVIGEEVEAVLQNGLIGEAIVTLLL